MTIRSPNSVVSEAYAQVYGNFKDHLMNNDRKPTGRDMPGRRPPFALRVHLPTGSDTIGGRFHLLLDRGAIDWKLGTDVTSAGQHATRTIFRRSNDFTIFNDIVWPDATLTTVGGYVQGVYGWHGGQLGGALRVDALDATAGTVSDFFSANTEGALDQTDTNISAALNASVQLSDGFVLTAGLGRSVRSATTLERYSDRFPSTKFQIAAEFMGNPALAPEEALEFNLGGLLQTERGSLNVDVFHRTIDHYITAIPDTSLPRRLPLSPSTVFRYINGDQARFAGFEITGNAAFGSWIDVTAALSHVRAHDTLRDEPVFGIAPFEQRYALHVHTTDRTRWGELGVTWVSDQKRVSATRFEQPTDGWLVLDLRVGLALGQGLAARLGIENLTDETYATHLNSLNPFTGVRINEIGRSLYLGLEYGF